MTDDVQQPTHLAHVTDEPVPGSGYDPILVFQTPWLVTTTRLSNLELIVTTTVEADGTSTEVLTLYRNNGSTPLNMAHPEDTFELMTDIQEFLMEAILEDEGGADVLVFQYNPNDMSKRRGGPCRMDA